MPVRSSVLGPVVVTGEDAKEFARESRLSRGTKAAADAVCPMALDWSLPIKEMAS